MTLERLPAAARPVLAALVADVADRPRYRGGFVVSDEGTSHAWGAVDTERFGSCAGTKEDVRRLGAALRRVGVDLSFDDVDALLAEALWVDYGRSGCYTVTVMPRIPKLYETPAERIRAKRARRVERLRAAGLCIVCGRVPATSTCLECGRAANARRKRKREAA